MGCTQKTSGATGLSLRNYKEPLESTFKKKTHIGLHDENKLNGLRDVTVGIMLALQT